MEYTDYETGATISHEQFIDRGLERGELIGKEVCGCVIIQDRTADAYIVYCTKHEATLELYEACKGAYEWLLEEYPSSEPVFPLGRALAKADGK